MTKNGLKCLKNMIFKFRFLVRTKVHTKVNTKVNTKVRTKVRTKVYLKVRPKLCTKLVFNNNNMFFKAFQTILSHLRPISKKRFPPQSSFRVELVNFSSKIEISKSYSLGISDHFKSSETNFRKKIFVHTTNN